MWFFVLCRCSIGCDQRSAYVHSVRDFSMVGRCITNDRVYFPYGVNGLNSGRVIEVVQYVDCRSIDKVGVESWCKVVLRSLVQRNVFRAA